MSESVGLRAHVAEDEAFLQRVYASTRADELAQLGWDPAQQRAFTQMQYQAQHRSYLAQFPAAEHSIIQRAGADVGRLIVDRSSDVLWLIDISLLPEHRNAGLGAKLICGLQAEATRAGKPVALHVSKANRARHLYQRLGFAETAGGVIYIEMAWRPGTEQMGWNPLAGESAR
jgi:GNAT superfamily N-acetyltransferase